MKTEKNTQKAVSHFKLTVPVVCPSCGGRMQRCYDNRRKASTWWCCPECKTTVSITDEDLQNGITERLNEVIADPERIEIPESAYEESQEVKRMSAEIDGFGITIDEMLVYIPQLTKRKSKLLEMKSRLPKERVEEQYGRQSNIIDYTYTNYDLAAVEADYEKTSDELSRAQLALDTVNQRDSFEFCE